MKSTVTPSLSALLLVIGSACVWDAPPVVPTVYVAGIEGILIEEDGCLRIDGSSESIGYAIVWQKDVLAIERRGDTVDIYKGEISDGETPIASWRLGDPLFGGGRTIGPEIADEHAGVGFSERCEGPYWFMGSIE